MKKRGLFSTMGAALLASVFLSACSGSGTPVYDAEAQMTSAQGEMIYEEMAPAAAYDPESGFGANELTDSSAGMNVYQSGRKLIRTVHMNVETGAFDSLIKTLNDKAAELGGYVENSDISGNSLSHDNRPIERYATFTFRIPVDKMDGFVSVVEETGNITSRSESAEDVTVQYSDLESRKKTLSVEQDRIWALLEKAESLESVIALEKRLSEIRYELESMESQLRMYDNQVEYSTIHLQVREVLEAAAFTPIGPESTVQRIQKGFNRNLNAMIQGLTGLLIWIISASPIWVPLVVILLIVYFFTKNSKKMRRKLLSKIKHPDIMSSGEEDKNKDDDLQ